MKAKLDDPNDDAIVRNAEKREETHRRLVEASGEFCTEDPFVAFLYEILRDHVPAGEVQRVLQNSRGAGPFSLSNGYLGRYAEWVVSQLRRRTT